MRWWRWAIPAVVVLIAVAAALLMWLRPSPTEIRPRAVANGDQEIAWLHNPTSYETWENFVWGVKRAEMTDDGPAGLEVDDSEAFPEKTTAVPEVVVRRKGYEGALRIRWYKVTDDAPQEAWVAALARRNPPPVAILAGWSSDRAKALADAMRDADWNGPRPLCLLAQATADKVEPESDNASAGQFPPLISLYDRSFRFCFTNRQMAQAVTDYVLSDPTLRPGPIVWPGLRAIPTAAAGSWVMLPVLATRMFPEPIPAFAIEWKDDPYSTDLNLKFREALQLQTGHNGVPRLRMMNNAVPFSTGRTNRANMFEAQVAEHILANLPPPGTRTVLIIPTVTAPARRTLRALVQGNSRVGHQIVAVTGDGLGVNALFRDREFAWPVRSLPIPFVQFTHADPFGWDMPGTTNPPPHGYELPPPPPGTVRTSTEDIRLFTRMIRVIAAAAFPEGSTALEGDAGTVAANMQKLDPPFFDKDGNRLSGAGEHVIVLRPLFSAEGANGKHHAADAILEVYVRRSGSPGWSRLHTLSLGHPHGGHME